MKENSKNVVYYYYWYDTETHFFIKNPLMDSSGNCKNQKEMKDGVANIHNFLFLHMPNSLLIISGKLESLMHMLASQFELKTLFCDL